MLRQTSKRHRLVVLVAVALCFPVAGMSGACGAYRRPAAPTAEESEAIGSGPLPYAVSVVPWPEDAAARRGRNPRAYAESAAELLEASGAFRSCRLDPGGATSADLVATSSGRHCNAAVIPVWTILTLGVVPTVFDDEECEGVVLRSARPAWAEPVEIEVRHKGTVVLGWAAVPLGLLPGWAHGSVRKDARYRERFRLDVLRRRADIERLAASPGHV